MALSCDYYCFFADQPDLIIRTAVELVKMPSNSLSELLYLDRPIYDIQVRVGRVILRLQSV